MDRNFCIKISNSKRYYTEEDLSAFLRGLKFSSNDGVYHKFLGNSDPSSVVELSEDEAFTVCANMDSYSDFLYRTCYNDSAVWDLYDESVAVTAKMRSQIFDSHWNLTNF